MKKIALTVLFSLLLLPFAFSQDIITTKSGDEINARVLEITPSEIKFTTADKADVMQILPKANVFMIKYENGKKDVFREEPAEITQAPALEQKQSLAPSLKQTPNRFGQTDPADVRNLSLQGQNDARRYYRDYKTAGTITLISTLLYPPVGLATAIGTSVTPPARHNLDYPDENLFAQPTYAQAYNYQARKTKSSKVWQNFGFGITPYVVIIAIVFIGIQQ